MPVKCAPRDPKLKCRSCETETDMKYNCECNGKCDCVQESFWVQSDQEYTTCGKTEMVMTNKVRCTSY